VSEDSRQEQRIVGTTHLLLRTDPADWSMFMLNIVHCDFEHSSFAVFVI